MTRQRRLATAGLAALTAAVLALVPLGSATAASAKAPVSERQITVMTRNLYLGADLLHLFSAPNPLLGAVQVLGTVEALHPEARMAGIADEVAAAKPDVLALQEAAVWHINGVFGLQPADYDFVALLRSALAAKGLSYTPVVSQTNFDSSVQLPALSVLGTYSDHDVILVRDAARTSDLQVLDTYATHYAAQTTIPLDLSSIGQGVVTIDFERGYEWADVKTRGVTWRVVNTHPEAYNPGSFGLPSEDVNGAEATELATALAGDTGPIVILGDLNSAKDEAVRKGYTRLVDAGFSDTWLALGKPNSANTCCYDELLTSGSLTERIDHVLARGLVQPKVAYHVGVAQEPTGYTLWPTDHAGVVTTFSVGKENG